MLVTRILPVVLHIHPDILGAELAVVDGQGDDLVAREFDGAGLVVADVAGELLQIRLVQTAQDLYPRARSIIALKRMHSCHSCGNQPVITARAFFARLSAVQLQV